MAVGERGAGNGFRFDPHEMAVGNRRPRTGWIIPNVLITYLDVYDEFFRGGRHFLIASSLMADLNSLLCPEGHSSAGPSTRRRGVPSWKLSFGPPISTERQTASGRYLDAIKSVSVLE